MVRDVAVDPNNGKIYGSDTLNNRVLRFLPNGDFDTVFATGIFQAFGIAVDPASNVYVAEDIPGRVHVFTSAGVPITTFDGGLPGFRPRYIDIDSQGRVIVGAAAKGVLIFCQCDVTPPEISVNVSGTLGNNGWHTSNVTISWTVVENDFPGSVVTSTTGCDTTSIIADSAGVTLTCSAVSDGGSASASVTVKRDATKPTITAPPDQVVPASDPSGVTVTFGAPTASDAPSGLASLTSSPASGSTFPVGVTTVTHTATDNAGNSSTATHQITVEPPPPPDFEPPLLTVPADIIQEGNTTGGANVTVPPATATDDVDPAPAVSCDGGSGFFPLGATLVTCIATDASGKSSAPGSFTVTVVDKTPPTVTVPGTVEIQTIDFEGGQGARSLFIRKTASSSPIPFHSSRLASSMSTVMATWSWRI